MKFLVDAQLPPALARALAEVGHEAVHVADIGLQSAPDAAIWREAVRRNAVIVTKNEDFIGNRADRLGKPAPPVIWVRYGNVTRRALLQSFMPLLAQVIALIEAGEPVVEVRGP